MAASLASRGGRPASTSGSSRPEFTVGLVMAGR